MGLVFALFSVLTTELPGLERPSNVNYLCGHADLGFLRLLEGFPIA